MDSNKSISTDLFYKIRSRFTGLKLGEGMGAITINPEDAVFFDFNYSIDEQVLGHVSISIAEPGSMKVYFSNGITEDMDIVQKDKWYEFLKELRIFAKRRLLNFDTRDVAKDNLDQRDFKFLSQYNVSNTVGESVMSESSLYGSRTVSYQKLMDTKLIIKHSKPIQDEQIGSRARNISALFVENQDGERFKYPFIHLAGARAMQRHVANGGVPYDDMGKQIVSMSEQIAQLKGFGNYVVRNDLLNSDTNSIYERSSEALNRMREEIARLSKQAYYEQFKNSFKAQDNLEVPQDVAEDFTEKFTVRNFKEDIKSVFPILYRLMKEESKIGYDDIVEMTGQEELEIDESDDFDVTSDPFSKFENWVNTLGEASAIQSEDDEEKSMAVQKLNELTQEHFAAGVNGTNAIESLTGIIEDPELDSAIKQAAKQDPDMCVRGLVKNWLEENAPDVLEQIDFGDFVDDEENVEDPMQYANDSADADAEYYGQKEEMTAEAKGQGDYEVDGEMSTVHFERDADGNPQITKIMLGSTDITSIEDLEEIASTIEPDDESPLEDVYTLLSIDIEAEHNPAERGSRERGSGLQLEPDYDAYSEVTSITAYGNGNKVAIYTDDLPKSVQDRVQQIADDMHSGDDDDYDYDDRYDYREGADADDESENDSKKSKVHELAEFIHSFYDKDSGTFPKGPESVCTMVGKKFGEQAESLARKLVEKLAPEQSSETNPELAELARIKELSGMGVAEESSGYYYERLAQEVFDENPNLDTSGRDPEVLNAVFPLLVRDLGSRKKANNLLNYDEDFAADFVSAYGELKRSSGSNESSTMELEAIRRLSGISQGMGF